MPNGIALCNFPINLILHADSVCDILRSIVDISESRRV